MRRWRYVLLAFLTVPASAQMTLELEQVVVTATRIERPMDDVPVPTTVITAHDIERSGASSLAEALSNEVPGMVFTPDAMGNNMRVRGLTTRYILVLVDGERLVAEGAGGNINLDRVAVGDIERIEIVGGAAAALWGANAVGGVINIITKDGDGAGASIAAGTHDIWRLGAYAGGTYGPLSGRGSVFRNSSGGFEGGSPYTDLGGSARAAWIKRRTSVQASGRIFNHETFNPENSASLTHTLARSWSAAVGGRYKWKNNTLSLDLSGDNHTGYTVFERRDNERERDSRASVFSVRATDDLRLNDHLDIIGGVEFNHEEAFGATTLASATRTLNTAALFAQGSWKPNAATAVTLGARYTESPQFGRAFTPGIAALRHLGQWRFRAGISTSFRPPSIKELYYNFDHQGMFWIYGNPLLEPERGLYAQFSAEYRYNTFAASATLYHNKISDKITQYDVLAPIDDGQVGMRTELHYKNVSSATLRGLDVNLTWGFWSRFILNGAYGLCHARDNATGRQLDSTPRHSATASLLWMGPVTVQAGARFLSSYTHLSSTGSTHRVGPSTIWRIAASRNIVGGLDATAKAENLLDKRTLNDPAGRQILIGLKYKF